MIHYRNYQCFLSPTMSIIYFSRARNLGRVSAPCLKATLIPSRERKRETKNKKETPINPESTDILSLFLVRRLFPRHSSNPISISFRRIHGGNGETPSRLLDPRYITSKSRSVSFFLPFSIPRLFVQFVLGRGSRLEHVFVVESWRQLEGERDGSE